MAEEPTVEEPKVEPTPEPTTSAKDDILAKLNELGIDSLDKIDGMSTASQQAGNLANQLGAVRQELEELKSQKQKETPTEYDYNNEGVDLGGAIRKELKAFWNDEQAKQAHVSQLYFNEMSQVQNDKRYDVLKETWEKHLSSMNTQQKLRSGQTTPTREYARIKDVYTDLLEEQLGKIPESAKSAIPPHVESGDTQSVPLPTVNEERKKKVRDAVDPKKGFTGDNDDIAGMIDAVIPLEDPILDR